MTIPGTQLLSEVFQGLPTLLIKEGQVRLDGHTRRLRKNPSQTFPLTRQAAHLVTFFCTRLEDAPCTDEVFLLDAVTTDMILCDFPSWLPCGFCDGRF